MKFDCVFFDSGGTLFGAGGGEDPTSRDVWDGRIDRLAALLGAFGWSPNFAALRAAVVKCEAECPRLLGASYNFLHLTTAVLEELGSSLGTEVAACLADAYAGPRYESWVFPGTKEVLRRFWKAGLHLGLIANTAWPGFCLDRALAGVGLLGFLRTRLYSGDIGIAKPDVRIFRLAERLSGMAGRKILYVGNDLEVDIKGAASAGWATAMRRPMILPGAQTPPAGAGTRADGAAAPDFEFNHVQELLGFVL